MTPDPEPLFEPRAPRRVATPPPPPPEMRPTVKLRAPAKVNLALAVGPAREGDGLHPIASWMHHVGLHDDVTLTRLADDYLSRYAILWAADAPRTSPIDWSITKDLGVRAHLLLEKEAGRALPVQMKVEKRIPVGGGLGGGSSDAAAVLTGVRELFGLDVSDDRLRELAMSLGSDVAFFVARDRSASIVEGVGERLTPAPRVEREVLLLLPDFPCPTGAVYRAFDALPAPAIDLAARSAEIHRLAMEAAPAPEKLFNDLAPAAAAAQPRLAELLREAGRAVGLPAHVTGSGSTMFVLGPRGESLDAAAEAVRAALPDIAVVRTRLA